MRALISACDKAGLDAFARGLVDLGWRLVSGGTAAFASRRTACRSTTGRGGHGRAGDARRPRQDAPSAHPRRDPRPPRRAGRRRHARGARDRAVRPRLRQPLSVRAGRGAARRDRGGDRRDDRRRRPVDAARRGEELRPLRAVSAGPSSTTTCSTSCASGELSLDTRRRLAAEAFAHTAAYEAAIATWFDAREEFPDPLVVSLDKVLDLAYGENPHQHAAYYARARRSPPPALAGRAARRQGALVQQPRRLSTARGASRASSRCRPRDRQAREPVRRRGRHHRRGGVRQGARRRPDLGVRLCRRR